MRYLIILAVSIFVFIPAFAFSATLKVPSQYLTIQDAINAASGGDTVLVDDGTYVENIDFLGKAITVTSVNGAAVTVIDGGKPTNPDFGSVVYFGNDEELDSVLDGFTLTNGSGTYIQNYAQWVYVGGGIYCYDASPTIMNNIFTSNHNLDLGGGLYGNGISSIGNSSLICNNTFADNSADFGGAFLIGYSSPQITNNVFKNNKAKEYGGVGYLGDNPFNKVSSPIIDGNSFIGNSAPGGAGTITLYEIKSTTISNNIFAGNTTGYNLYGSGTVSLSSVSSAMIANNIFYGNLADKGGAIDCTVGTIADIVNNTIYGNSAQKGGAISCQRGTIANISNTILWNNDAPIGPEIWIAGKFSPSTVNINYSNLKGGKSSVHIENNCTLNWKSGMIDANPLFVSPTNDDFHLTWLSPCINRGTNDGAPSEDFEGDPRPFMGTIDMGADEFTGTHPLEADLFALSEVTGGIVNLSVNGGTNNAGRNYLILGSVTGTAPGTPLPGGQATLPLNWDFFTNVVIEYSNTSIFSNFVGSLDGMGSSTAALDTLGPIPGAAGLTLHFAYALNNPWDFVSNPVAIEIVP